MHSVSLITYFFSGYVLLHLMSTFLKNTYFSRSLVILSNLLIGFYFYTNHKETGFDIEVFFPLYLVLGNSLFLLMNKSIDKSKLTLINIQFLLSIFFITTPFLILNILSIVFFIRTCSLVDREPAPVLYDFSFTCLLTVFLVLQFVWTGDYNVLSLKSVISDNNVALGMIIFFLVYPGIRLFIHYDDFSKEKRCSAGNVKLWLWFGVVGAYFLKLAFNLGVFTHLNETSILVLTLLVMAVGVLIFFKIENSESSTRRFSLFLVFNYFFALLSFFTNTGQFKLLYWTNSLLVLVFLLVNFSNKKLLSFSFFDIMNNLGKVLLVIFLVGMPFTPWFSLKFGVLSYFLKAENVPFFVIFSIVLGLRFRQDVLFVPTMFKLKLSDKSKPS